MLRECTHQIEGQILHTYESTSGLPDSLIFVHGIGVSSRYMLPLAEQLAPNYNIYVVDLPGFGKSSKPNGVFSTETLAAILTSFIRQQKITNPALVANSFGCQVSLKAIKANSDLITAAILIGPTINKFERTYGWQIVRWIQNLLHEPVRKMAYIFMKDIWECGLLRVFKTLRISLKDKPEVGLDRIAIPVLLVRGELDPIVPRLWLDYLQSRNRHFQIAEISGAGHALNFNSPGTLARLITAFLDPVK